MDFPPEPVVKKKKKKKVKVPEAAPPPPFGSPPPAAPPPPGACPSRQGSAEARLARFFFCPAPGMVPLGCFAESSRAFAVSGSQRRAPPQQNNRRPAPPWSHPCLRSGNWLRHLRRHLTLERRLRPLTLWPFLNCVRLCTRPVHREEEEEEEEVDPCHAAAALGRPAGAGDARGGTSGCVS